METLFDLCMRMIHRAVTPPTAVSEWQYHRIVECIRYLADPNTLPEIHPTAKKQIMEKYGLSEKYNPFEDPPRIRFFMSFTHDDDDELQRHLNDFDTARQEYDGTPLLTHRDCPENTRATD